MADSTIANTKFRMTSGQHFAGPAPIGSLPTSLAGLTVTNPIHHNVASPVYKVGEKITLWDPSTRSYVTFIYLKVGSQGASSAAIKAGSLCGMYVSSSLFVAGNVTNVIADTVDGSPGVLALSAMTTSYYGWFQCDGLPAIGLVSALESSTILGTDGTVAAGAFTLGTYATSYTGAKVHAAGDAIVGIASAADA